MWTINLSRWPRRAHEWSLWSREDIALGFHHRINLLIRKHLKHGWAWDLPGLPLTYHDLPKKNIHGLRCFKMRWFHLDTKHEKTYAHLYTTSSFKEQWLDRNVSAALRNDAPRIREEGLHIRQPCAAEAPNMAMSSTLSKFMAHFCIWKSESHFWDDSHMFQLYQQSNICSNIQHVWRGQLWGKCHYVSLWPFGKRPGLALNIWGIEMERKPIIGLKWYIMI